MSSVLIQNMIEQHHYPVLTQQTLDDFTGVHAEAVLFFTENPVKFPESNDVAMILPELVKAFDDRFAAAVIDQAEQRKLQMRYGFSEWPALVFLRNGEYLGAICRVQDWNTYLTQIQQILASDVTRPPTFNIPVSGAADGCC